MKNPFVKIFKGLVNRVLQVVTLFIPGATTVRPFLHRLRGVHIGKNCFIGTSVILETESPERIFIDSFVSISVRTTFIAHYRRTKAEKEKLQKQKYGIIVEKNVFIGPGCIILPNVTIGEGSVVTAGSVVTLSVPPKTMVQGNPAKPIAICNVPLYPEIYTHAEFLRNLRPVRSTTNGTKKKIIPDNELSEFNPKIANEKK